MLLNLPGIRDVSLLNILKLFNIFNFIVWLICGNSESLSSYKRCYSCVLSNLLCYFAYETEAGYQGQRNLLHSVSQPDDRERNFASILYSSVL